MFHTLPGRVVRNPRFTRLGLTLALVFAPLLSLVPTIRAATLVVCPSGCTYTGIQAAIDAAAPGDTITIRAGTYQGRLYINKSLILDGAGATQTTINGGGGGPAIWNDSTPSAPNLVTIIGVTITGGDADYGGGISNEFGTLTVRNSIVSGNFADYGGGIYNNGWLTVHNSTINNNTSYGGGGICNEDSTTAVYNSTVSNNSAGGQNGGSILNRSGTVTVLFCTVTGNRVNSSGGGPADQRVTIRRDATPPTIMLYRRTRPNAAGWNTTPVLIEWDCRDTMSGPLSPQTNQTVNSEGVNQRATGTCTDRAGNHASATETGINIDLTKPTTSVSASIEGSAATVTLAANDALSGVASTSYRISVTRLV